MRFTNTFGKSDTGLEELTMNTTLRCPKCHQEQLSRIARQGFLRNQIYPIFGFYPWECAICRRETLLRKRGGSYRRVSASRSKSGLKDRTPSTESSSRQY